MGRGVITKNIGAGKYKITRVFATDYVKKLAALVLQIDKVEKRIAELIVTRDKTRFDINVATTQMNLQLLSNMPDKAKVAEFVSGIAKNTTLYDLQTRMIASENVKRADFMEAQALLVTLQRAATAEIEVWCTTYSTNLTGSIETIEVDDQINFTLIAPEGHSALPGLLKQIPLSSPEEVFYNAAMLPGVQKWKPRYKIGVIQSIDKVANTCTVTLYETSLTKLKTLIKPVLTGVPVKYLGCNSSAFLEGDEVVVEFTGRVQATPVVIGFLHDPRPCLPLLHVQIHSGAYSDYSMVWDGAKEAHHVIGSPAVVFPCKTSTIAEWLTGRSDAGKDLFTTQSGGFAVEDWAAYDSDCQIVTPSNSACQKNTQVPCVFNGPNGAGGLVNTRQVNRVGSAALFGMVRIEEMLMIYDVIPQARRSSVVPQNVASTRNTYGEYDVPFPTQKITALNGCGYVGSVGTSFISGPGEPFFWHYRFYYGYPRYDEVVTKHYSVVTPLGIMYAGERRSIWTQFPGGDVSYDMRTFDNAQGIIGGQYSTTSLTHFYLMQYLEKVSTKAKGGAAVASYNDRVVTVHAQMYANPGGLPVPPYNAYGRSAELEAAIVDLVDAWYAGNNLSLKELKQLTVTWKIIS